VDDLVEQLRETGRRNGRKITYFGGTWRKLRHKVPQFETRDFRVSPDGPANPFMQTVTRLAANTGERAIPIAAVSNSYTLAQHHVVAENCLAGVQNQGIETKNLRCELGITDLGEWMNFRIYFPREYNYVPRDGKSIGLRLECFNSVDASCRLVVLLGWFRFVCSNGMIIGRTMAELRDVHGKYMNLDNMSDVVSKGLDRVEGDISRLVIWEAALFDLSALKLWANEKVSSTWGKKAACRVYHICRSGYDVEITNPFARGDATEKPVRQMQEVSGAMKPARNLYDASQALSWVATNRQNPEQRIGWQSDIPKLIGQLRAYT